VSSVSAIREGEASAEPLASCDINARCGSARSRALSKNPGASPPHSFRRPRAGGAITVSYNRGGGQLSVRLPRLPGWKQRIKLLMRVHRWFRLGKPGGDPDRGIFIVWVAVSYTSAGTRPTVAVSYGSAGARPTVAVSNHSAEPLARRQSGELRPRAEGTCVLTARAEAKRRTGTTMSRRGQSAPRYAGGDDSNSLPANRIAALCVSKWSSNRIIFPFRKRRRWETGIGSGMG
jgi:hypothetical protein